VFYSIGVTAADGIVPVSEASRITDYWTGEDLGTHSTFR